MEIRYVVRRTLQYVKYVYELAYDPEVVLASVN